MSRYEHAEFDVELRIQVESSVTIPTIDKTDAGGLWALFGNASYLDLAELDRADAQAVQQEEAHYLDRIGRAEDWRSEYEEILDEILGNFEWPGLDLGVAGTVLALNAVGCLTGASCNGGAFGDWHHEDHPLVVFVAPADLLKGLCAIALKVGAGLQTTPRGAVLLYTRDIGSMMAFGPEVLRPSVLEARV